MEHLIESAIFFQIVSILVLASIVGFVAVKCRQPLIVAFIIAGVLAGPYVFDIVRPEDAPIIETFSKFGIALLLFMVGLKLDLRIMEKVGAVALIAGISQVAATFAFGWLVAVAMGLGYTSAAFIGLALSFSSTIIAVKILSDKRAIDSLYGRLSLGILIVQDLIVILATIVIAALSGGEAEQNFGVSAVFLILLKGAGLILFTALFIKFLARRLADQLAKNTELLVLCCVSFAVMMAAACEYFHFSQELGGLVAGVALASTPYNNVIAGRLSALRDFMLLFFFANLGAHINLAEIGAQFVPAVILSVFVLVCKPAIVMAILHALKFRKRTGFLAGMTLGQISEFSLILTAMGVSAGFLDGDMLNLMTLTGLITMTLSTYGIVYSGKIYMFLENRTAIMARSAGSHHEEKEHHELQKPYDVIIFGLGRYGDAIARLFKKRGYTVLGVDFDPDAITRAQEAGIPSIYGDAADTNLAGQLPLSDVKIAIFSFHHYVTGPVTADLRRTLAKSLRDEGYKGYIAATSHHPEHDKDLPDHGIDLVFNPFEDAAFKATEKAFEILEK